MGGGQTLQKYLKERLELIELNATHQIVTARSSTSATKDGAKEPLEFFPVDAVDDEVDWRVESHHEVGDLSQGGDRDVHRLKYFFLSVLSHPGFERSKVLSSN